MTTLLTARPRSGILCMFVAIKGYANEYWNNSSSKKNAPRSVLNSNLTDGVVASKQSVERDIAWWRHVDMYSNNARQEVGTLRERGMAMPTMKRKKGMTKSARLQPFHGACPMTGHSPPAPSTSIISCTQTNAHADMTCRNTEHC